MLYVVKETRHCDCTRKLGRHIVARVQGTELSRSEHTLESPPHQRNKLLHKHRDRVKPPLVQMKEHWVAAKPIFEDANAIIWAPTKASNKSGRRRSMTGIGHKGSQWTTSRFHNLGHHDEAWRPAPQGATSQCMTTLSRLQGKGNILLWARLPRHS